jgi:hypothetical protein
MTSEQGTITDERGRVKFKPTTGEKVAISLGATPLRLAKERGEVRRIITGEQRDKDADQQAVDDYLDAREAKDVEAIADARRVLVKRRIPMSSVMTAKRNRLLSPKERALKLVPKRRREQYKDDEEAINE